MPIEDHLIKLKNEIEKELNEFSVIKPNKPKTKKNQKSFWKWSKI